MKNPWIKRILVTLVILFLLGITAVGSFIAGVTSGLFAKAETTALSEEVITGKDLENKIGILRLEGLILTAGPSSPIPTGQGVVTAIQVKRWLREIAKDDELKALVIELNSPGGSPVAADEIYQAIKAFQTTGKSVVVVMEDTATSGAYFLAVAADRVIANPATLTGSIGVLAEITNARELLAKIGVEIEVYKSGKFKDLTSLTRDRSEEEKALIQEYIDTAHELFIARVIEGRKLPENAVRALAEGQIYSGEKAVELGLIDSLGSIEDGVEAAKQLEGLREVKIVRYRTETALDLLLGRISILVNPLLPLISWLSTPGLRAMYLPDL